MRSADDKAARFAEASAPFRLELPAVVSLSGGRTSAYMLWRILQTYGGEQPDDLKICFQNTGLEHPATYDFLRDCATHWGIRVTWLEYALTADNKATFEVVDYETASRKGEPFTRLISKKNYLPNPVARLCTSNLKVETQKRYLKSLPRFADGYVAAVGLRYDEPHRAQRIKSDNGREEIVCPLYDGRVTKAQVLDWWSHQPFDLSLPANAHAGNCVGCFLKGRGKLEALMRDMPEQFAWWVNAERQELNTGTARFRSDRPDYATMMEQVRRQGVLFPPRNDDESLPCMCHD